MAEGIAFRASDSPRPFPLPLPEDNVEAFIVLANVAHHRADAIPPCPSTQILIDLALLVDKYACAASLMSYGVLWLQRGLAAPPGDHEFTSLEGRCRMLLFAYVLDLPEPFAAVSWEILLHHRQGFKDELRVGFDLPIAKDHELLRHDIHGEFQRRKSRLRREVMWALMEPVEEINGHISRSRHPPCQKTASLLGNYLILLDKHDLSAWKSQYETDSFDRILWRARQVGTEEAANDFYQFDPCNKKICSCGAVATRPHLARKLKESVDGAWHWKLWLCLDCIKTDGESYSTRNCRVEHW